jgi:hypothetical protein
MYAGRYPDDPELTELIGEITVQYETLQPPGEPGQLLVTYTVEAGSTSEQNLRLLASWTAADSRSVVEAPEIL